jgi:hypothetical protein
MVRHGDYLKDFFFDNSELDKDGQFVEIPKYKKNPKDFFKSIKKQNIAKKITKKEFQENIKNFNIAQKYVEILVPRSSYYKYTDLKKAPLKENWFFMENNNNLIFCFTNK